jgi:CBS-domain-containing membrane protein
MPVTEAQAQMKREKIHHLPVPGKDDRLAGIVTDAVTRAGGNIIAMGTVLGEYPTHGMCTIDDVRDA